MPSELSILGTGAVDEEMRAGDEAGTRARDANKYAPRSTR
jgi:hypothetical protein